MLLPVPALTGCLYLPVDRLVQPSGTVTVLDPAGHPIAGARVHVRILILPWRGEAMTAPVLTDAAGRARFEQLRMGRLELQPMVLQPVFHWGLCIEHPGYRRIEVKPAPRALLDRRVVLAPREGSPDRRPDRSCAEDPVLASAIGFEVPGLALVAPREPRETP